MSSMVEISLEAVLASDNLHRAWAAVKANAGAGGVDGKGIGETERHLKRTGRVSGRSSCEGDYQPAAVRAVDIAKPGGGHAPVGYSDGARPADPAGTAPSLSAAFDGE